MKGKRVERVWGWDCHGLPAEVFTEKKLGIEDKRDVGTKISLEEYITTCRDNMVQTGSEWEDTIDRVGRWVNFKGAYKTMDREYMESVWWAFKQLYEKDKIYEGEKVLLYCTRDATPISKAEVAMDNSYQDVTDPSVYVKFKLKDENRHLLVWTTTPWTLPSNSAIAVNQELTYAEVEIDGTKLVLAEELLDKALTDEKHRTLDYQKIRTFSGKELVGKSYEPLFAPEEELAANDKAFKIWHAEFVHAEDGTGIAHESPAYGEDDYQLSRENGFPWIMSTDESGVYTIGEWKGENVWEINKTIAKTLLERGVVWKIDYIRHSYPHCHRCGTKLMYRAHPSWFMDIDSQRETMLEENSEINWFPSHIKTGRFHKTVETAPDWNLSRDRFWATPMPVWKSEKGDIKVVGSYAELKELSGVELEDYHRPWIDEVTFEIEGVKYERIEKVMDCWFESGSMPFAQFHYPFENKEKFERSFPGDFIAEYVGQVRAWFYYLHAISVGLFGEQAFSNVIVTGTLAGNDGRKMSKSFGNFTDPNELMDEYSADALRFLLLSSPVLAGEDFSLQDKDVSDVNRKLAMIWNMYDFFTLYAEVDGWEWDGSYDDPIAELENPLDRWIVSKVHILGETVDEYMQEYDIPSATKQILPFIDDASNWYVRRSRKRFWKTEDDNDKGDAYRTLHYVLLRLAHIMAPFTPFLAEELFIKLTAEESVHLREWPTPAEVDAGIVAEMATIRQVVTDGLALRAKSGIKARQPLAALNMTSQEKPTPEMESVILEELNVKKLNHTKGTELSVALDTEITPELELEGMARDIIRRVQNHRKKRDLKVDDRILLGLNTESAEVRKAIEEWAENIKSETLATDISQKVYSDSETVNISSHPLEISLEKSED